MKQTALVRRPKSKGNAAEREVIEILKAHGYPARRNFASGGYGGNDILGGPPGFGIEVKRQERLNIWAAIEQCRAACAPSDTPTVVFRRSRSEWMACLPFEDLLGLIAEARA